MCASSLSLVKAISKVKSFFPNHHMFPPVCYNHTVRPSKH